MVDEAQVLSSKVLSNEFMDKTEDTVVANGDSTSIKRDSEKFPDICLRKIVDIHLII